MKYLQFYHTMYPNITKLHSIGKSVQGRDLWIFVISNTPNEHIAGKPEFKYIANMHGNEVVGREMLLYLIKYLCERYGIDDRVTNLLNTTRIHLLPSMNPDGYEMSTEGDASSLVGRNNANNYDLNRNFPDQYGTNKEVIQPETQAVMDWTLSEPFVLSANLHNGALVANYPFDDTANGSTNENLSPDDAVFKYLAHTYANVSFICSTLSVVIYQPSINFVSIVLFVYQLICLLICPFSTTQGAQILLMNVLNMSDSDVQKTS
nr:unnamed protein product [Callosobruchus analis]